jgi:hypothetical protein
MQNTDAVPQRNWIGLRCSFDYDGKRLAGVVTAQEWSGLTVRGAIPDWSLCIRGQSGKTLTVSLVNNYVSFYDE